LAVSGSLSQDVIGGGAVNRNENSPGLNAGEKGDESLRWILESLDHKVWGVRRIPHVRQLAGGCSDSVSIVPHRFYPNW
jgi:hypothetical protein